MDNKSLGWDKEKKKKFGKGLKALRNAKGQTSKVCSGILGIPDPTYKSYETGSNGPAQENLDKILGGLGMTLEQVIEAGEDGGEKEVKDTKETKGSRGAGKANGDGKRDGKSATLGVQIPDRTSDSFTASVPDFAAGVQRSRIEQGKSIGSFSPSEGWKKESRSLYPRRSCSSSRPWACRTKRSCASEPRQGRKAASRRRQRQ